MDVVNHKFVITANHFPHLIEPFRNSMGPEVRYSLRVPPEMFPDVIPGSRAEDDLGPLVSTSGHRPPLVQPGYGSGLAFDQWEHLLMQARRWQYPVDRLFWNRECTVAGYTWNQDYYSSNLGHRSKAPIKRATLVGVRVGGDLQRDEGLAKHILEMTGFFN